MLGLTENDLLLIHALQLSPRLTWSEAGSILSIHPSTLAARWTYLQSTNVAWIGAQDVSLPDRGSFSFVSLRCDRAHQDAAARQLAQCPEVVSVAITNGEDDIELEVLTRSVTDLATRIIPHIERITGVTRISVKHCTRLHSRGDSWRLRALSSDQQSAVLATVHRATREGDIPVELAGYLKPLGTNGRASAAALARALDVHPTTAQRQLKRLLTYRSLAFRTEVAQELSGFPLNGRFEVSVPRSRHDHLVRALARVHNKRLVASATGTHNFVLYRWLHHPGDVYETEELLYGLEPRIDDIRSTIVLSMVKRGGRILNRDTTAADVVFRPPLTGSTQGYPARR